MNAFASDTAAINANKVPGGAIGTNHSGFNLGNFSLPPSLSRLPPQAIIVENFIRDLALFAIIVTFSATFERLFYI